MTSTVADIATARFDGLGTEIVVSVTNVAALAMVLEHAHRCIDDVDRTFSRFRTDSELERLKCGGGSQQASPLFIELLELALRAARSTDGLFDPTIRDALEAAGYDREINVLEADGPGATRPALPAGRWSEIELDARRGTVCIPDGVRLDFGGIGKGFAVDYILRGLPPVDCGVLISAGGDLAVSGPTPQDGWICDVATPNNAAIEETVLLTRGAMATSGLGRRTWTRDDESLHHLIDPLTGKPAASPWSFVSVIAGTCLIADVAAKVAFLKGAEGPDWIDGLGLAARFRNLDGSIRRTARWPIQAEER